MDKVNSKKVALIVALPCDETLWAGGTILSHASWDWFIVCLCGGGATGRAQKYTEALVLLRAEGVIGDLHGEDEQQALNHTEVAQTIKNLLPANYFDLIISHHPGEEYTSNIWQKETGKAVIKLWHSGLISAGEFRAFAYEDGEKSYLPKAVETANICHMLSKRIWRKNKNIIMETYGFDESSFEAKTTPTAESFWPFTNTFEARRLLR